MEVYNTLLNALLQFTRIERAAGDNDAAFRKQCRIVLNSPTLAYALSKARDAPDPAQEQPTAAPKRKRTTKPPSD